MNRRTFFGFAAAPLASILLTEPQDTSKLSAPKPEIANELPLRASGNYWRKISGGWCSDFVLVSSSIIPRPIQVSMEYLVDRNLSPDEYMDILEDFVALRRHA
jgi:hypothetical protein